MSVKTQRNFAGGELAPALYGRVDTSKYQAGLRTLRNMIVMRSGGAQNRSGSEYIAEVHDSSRAVRLIPFIFNQDQAYVLELSHQTMRFYRDGNIISNLTLSISSISNTSQCLITCNTFTFLAPGFEVYISGISGMTELNGRYFKVGSVPTTTNFTIQTMAGVDVDSTSFGAYTSGGTVDQIVSVVTPWSASELFDIQYVQSADVMTLTHPSYVPRELSRASETSWSIASANLSPDISPAKNLILGGGAATGTSTYRVISVGVDGEESTSLVGTIATVATAGNTIGLGWDFVSNAVSYKVYRKTSSSLQYYLITETVDNQPSDTGAAGTAQFPSTYSFNGTGVLPGDTGSFFASAVTYFQQRLLYANGSLAGTTEYPETVWASKIGHFNNFYQSVPDIVSSDAFSFTMSGREVNAVRHLVDLEKLIILTAAGEYFCEGDPSTGAISPTSLNIRQFGYNGASKIRPVVVGGNLLYVQARGTIIRDLSFQWVNELYKGNDITLFSTHLFDGYTLIDMAHQQVPHSILWAVRSDGTLLGVTYVPEQQMLAWSRHDFTGGTVESVCTVPEGSQNAVYVVVNRTINGSTKRYVERFVDRFIDADAQEDMVFMDAAVTYDGRNTDNSHTMTVSGGTTWAYTETLTLTSSSSFFTSSDVGNEIHITTGDTLVRFVITAYTSTTVVSVLSQMTVPSAIQSVATSNWSRAVDVVTELWHLEGQAVSALGDGNVIASPYNSAYSTVTVSNGQADFGACYSVIQVGLPYVSDLETLDIDSSDGETLQDKQKLVTKLVVNVHETRGMKLGLNPGDDTSITRLTEPKIRDNEGYDDPISLKTGIVNVNIQSNWNSNGRIFIRQVDPLPMTILSVSPAGMVPFRGQQ